MKSGEIYLFKDDDLTKIKLEAYVGNDMWYVKFLNNAVYLDFSSGEMTSETYMEGTHIFEHYTRISVA